MPTLPKRPLIALAVLAGLLAAWLGFAAWYDHRQRAEEQPATYSMLIDRAARGEIASVTFAGGAGHAEAADGSRYRVVMPVTDDLLKELRAQKVAVAFDDGPGGLIAQTVTVLDRVAPFLVVALLIGGLLLSGGQFFGMGRSTRIRPEDTGTVFRDVAGVDEAKEELRETVQFLKDPRRFAMAGARVPKGILLVGPPGTGKTMLAKAAAGEAGVPFFAASGSDFVEMFVGLGAARVRSLFKTARANAPCLLFIDEIDALAGKRGESNSHSEREQTLNQLLVEMDGIIEGGEVVVIAATNRSEMLDPAVTRPGRFDRHIHVGLPDVAGRTAILDVHAGRLTLAPDVCTRTVARGTPGFSGAELANLANEAALSAARQGRVIVGMSDFEAAKDRVLMGTERRSLALSAHERRLTAYHEAGHALVSLRCPEADPIHKATIIPRGGALGMVVRLPEGDRVSVSRAKLLADISVAMAGRAAEELIFGDDHVTTGAEADFRAATDLARRMVAAWGMSEAIGFVSHAGNDPGARSERTAWRIDEEIRRITDERMDHARRLLRTDRNALDAIAKALLERETLSGDEIAELADRQEERATEAA
ncbi:ATP-dependent zinc metalloprotease FtsH [Azospirillum picis]|uniref:ATP-dependent zinc metalloprotease FtsH n=1 Tax=Azospirillum picis TaxID=488438 RepID=A0ABU0MFX4_9PROT|nr:ATP-dependent zinc metalloprotease FtsH [Azospirillum picis]MBP2298603.1 cell division protease FtsH [Azospirillum picis]MDQ0532348.1 cell division protease FtsH [Azospirillum picis]